LKVFIIDIVLLCMDNCTCTKLTNYRYFGLFPVLLLAIPLAYGSSPYDSGYDHGCDDAGLSPSDRYINEPGKGPSYHTEEFMSGYRDGFNNCGGGGSGGGGGESREDLTTELCNLIDNNRAAATGLALLLGYPGLDQAALALCDR
jgi:hypothetical protein